jgi:hypothetical protein
LVADRIKEPRDVSIEDPVYLASCDSDVQRIQRLVLVAPGPESVAEAQKFRLIDRRENRHYRSLDKFVLKRGNAERPLSAIRFRYVLPP